MIPSLSLLSIKQFKQLYNALNDYVRTVAKLIRKSTESDLSEVLRLQQELFQDLVITR